MLVEIVSRLGAVFGGPRALEEIYYDHLSSPRPSMFPRVASFLLTPRDLYWAGTTWLGPSLFSIIEGKFEELPDGRLRETLVIPSRYSDCPLLFSLMRGGLRAAPSLIGFPDSDVELETTARKAVFTITAPKGWRSPVSRLLGLVTRRRSHTVVKALAEQQVRLGDNLRQLHTAHDRIARQEVRLEEVNRTLRQRSEELDTRVRERTARLDDANQVLVDEIAEHRRAAVALLLSRERLRTAERHASVETFAAGIAHEINNPLAAILAAAQYATVCLDEPDSREILSHGLLDIEREAKRCGSIVKDISQFARDEPMVKRAANLNDVVHSAAMRVRTLIVDAGTTVEEVPSPQPIYCRMNPVQIERVVINLLRNAIECSDSGVEIRLSLAVRNDRAFVCVEDSGPGIAEKYQPQVFDPFFTTRRWNGQVGMGLSVARGIIREHDGTIGLESKVAVGTRVWFELDTCTHGVPERV